MLAQTSPENPLAELSKYFDENSNLHKDFDRLNTRIDILVKTINLETDTLFSIIEKRAGKGENTETKVQSKRTIESDTKEFAKGIGDVLIQSWLQPLKDSGQYLFGKSELPPMVEKDMPDAPMPEEKYNTNLLARENTSYTGATSEDTNSQNKVLSDMVSVLIDMRDDKSQKLLLGETISIKNLISEQSKKIEVSKGIEPNVEESKDIDREKLAMSIANHLREVMEDMGIGSNAGFDIPDLPDRGRRKPQSTKIPKAAGIGVAEGVMAAETAAVLGGTTGAVAIGGSVATAGATGVLATEQAKPLREAVTENPMLGAMSGDTAAAAAIINEGEKSSDEKEKIDRENKLLETAPWYTRMYGIGRSDFLKNPTTIEGASDQEASNARTNLARTDPRRVDVMPKENQVKFSEMLKQVNDENTELKMYSENQSTQMLAPIVSNRTVNNTEQTIIGSSPNPHPSMNSFIRWQDKKGGYVD